MLSEIYSGMVIPWSGRTAKMLNTLKLSAKSRTRNAYYKANDKTKNIEALRRSAESIMRKDIQERLPQKVQGMEL